MVRLRKRNGRNVMEKKQFTGNLRYPTRGSLIHIFLLGSRRWFFLSILLSAFASLADLLNPRIIAYTVDVLLRGDETKESGLTRFFSDMAGGTEYLREHLGLVAAAVIAAALFGALCRYLFQMCNSVASERLMKNMRDMLFSHLERMTFSWYSSHPAGDIIQRCTSDTETVRRFLSEQMTEILRIILLIGLALNFMFRLSVPLAVPAALFVPVVFAYSLFFHRRIGETFLRADEEEGVLSTIAQENLTGVRVVRAFGRESTERRKFEEQNTVYTAAYKKLGVLISAFWSVGDFISGLQVLLITALGAVFCVRGSLTAGDYIAFVAYNAMLSWPVRTLGRVVSQMSRAGVSVDRIREIMNAEPERDPEEPEPYPEEGDIVFDHVRFRYGEDLPWVLEDVSFTVPRGKTVGILGGTGSGKSTLGELLDRLYDLEEGCGEIRIGDTNLNRISRKELRRHVGIVLQEPFLFSGSIRDNILMAAPDSADRETLLREAAGTADLTGTVSSFAEGYDTMVGERGVTLSGGQKQRTAIAQTLVRDVPVMIFDDSLSAVDAETDARIRNNLKKLYGTGKTIILISHRILTLMDADEIIVLNRGRVAERGTHRQLMEAGGIYRTICDIQNVQENAGEGGL